MLESFCELVTTSTSTNTHLYNQGRSCKQICWPPGFGGLQRVGLDPGQYDHHPHGLVHVGQLQDVQTIVPVIQEAHLGLITVSSSVMQFCNLVLFSTLSGVKSWAPAKAGGAGKCDFRDARQSTQSLGSEDCYFYPNSI